jgi:transcriptional antiterminator
MAKKNSNYRERQEKILKFMAEAGAWKISSSVVQELAKEYGVTERQIYMDIKRIIKKVPKPVIEEVANKFLISFDKAITKSIRLMDSPNETTQLKSIRLYFESIQSFTKFLEDYGLKERVPEKIDLGGIKIRVNEPTSLYDDGPKGPTDTGENN